MVLLNVQVARSRSEKKVHGNVRSTDFNGNRLGVATRGDRVVLDIMIRLNGEGHRTASVPTTPSSASTISSTTSTISLGTENQKSDKSKLLVDENEKAQSLVLHSLTRLKTQLVGNFYIEKCTLTWNNILVKINECGLSLKLTSRINDRN